MPRGAVTTGVNIVSVTTACEPGVLSIGGDYLPIDGACWQDVDLETGDFDGMGRVLTGSSLSIVGDPFTIPFGTSIALERHQRRVAVGCGIIRPGCRVIRLTATISMALDLSAIAGSSGSIWSAAGRISLSAYDLVTGDEVYPISATSSGGPDPDNALLINTQGPLVSTPSKAVVFDATWATLGGAYLSPHLFAEFDAFYPYSLGRPENFATIEVSNVQIEFLG